MQYRGAVEGQDRGMDTADPLRQSIDLAVATIHDTDLARYATAAWRRLLRAFLARLHAAPGLYRTPVVRAAFETRARANIAQALSGLRSVCISGDFFACKPAADSLNSSPIHRRFIAE